LKEISLNENLSTKESPNETKHEIEADAEDINKENDIEDNIKYPNLSENSKNNEKLSSYNIRLKHYPDLNYSALYNALINIIEIAPSIQPHQTGRSYC
jgi:hypothetical protein